MSTIIRCMKDGPSTRERLIDAAIAMIDERGEPALRLADIAAATGIRTPSIYYFFEDREALVVAAHRERYRRSIDETIDTWLDALGEAETRADFIAACQAGLRFGFDAKRAEARSIRVQMLARAVHTPELLAELVDASYESNQKMAVVIAEAQSKGWVQPDIDPLVMALWVRGQMLSRFNLEIDSARYDGDVYNDIAIEAILKYLVTPE